MVKRFSATIYFNSLSEMRFPAVVIRFLGLYGRGTAAGNTDTTQGYEQD